MRQLFLMLIFLSIIVANLFTVSAQTRKKPTANAPRKPAPKPSVAVAEKPKPPPPLQCTKSNPSNEPMTYLVGSSKLGKADKKRIEATYGKLIIPEGETERAKELRQRQIEYERKMLADIRGQYDAWLAKNPSATEEDRRKRLGVMEMIIQNLTDNQTVRERVAKPSWDWRDKGIDVGPVYDQGRGCNTCWAFAAASAAATSIQKNYFDSLSEMSFTVDIAEGRWMGVPGARIVLAGQPGPFAQDLLNCMPIPEEEICYSGWHGRAFDFMVFGRGVPMVYRDGYTERDEATGVTSKYRRLYAPGQKFACSPNNGFRKALGWDYVSSPPDRQPTVSELKTALIKYGPIVAPITFSDCLIKYRGGIFNENDTDKINHVVLLIGWDDAKEAWLVKNSWGESWGEKGFGWIKYGSSNIGVFAAWIDFESNAAYRRPD